MSNSIFLHTIFNKHRLSVAIALLAILCLMIGPVVLAAPPDHSKGGKKGGGGTTGPVPELHLKWRAPLDAPYSSVRPAVANNGTVYVVDVNDTLAAFAPADGAVLWKVPGAGSRGVDVGPDGTVYTGNENWIKAFNPDGSLKWTYVQEPRALVLADVAVGPDGHIYAVASSGMGVFSLKDTPAGPELRWTNPEAVGKYFYATEIDFGPTANGGDHQLYFFANGHTRAVRLSDGASIFTLADSNHMPKVSPFDGSWHRGDSAYTPSGNLMWTFDFPVIAGSSDADLARDGTHYTVNWFTSLYAIDPNGREEWHTELNEWVGQVYVDPNETLLIMDTLGTWTHPAALKAVRATNGSDAWRMEFPADGSGVDQFVDSGLAFSPNGDTAYVMTARFSADRTYLNAVDTNPSIPNASTVLRATDITMNARTRRGIVKASGTVTVMNENLALLSGAVVNVTWTLPDGSTLQQSATSSGGGEAKFSISGSSGSYKIKVTGISMDGYTFDPDHSLLSAAEYF